MAERQSVLGPESQWRDPVAGVGDGLRPSVLGPDGDWRELPSTWWTRRRVAAAVVAALVVAALAAGARAVAVYAPVVPGSTFGLDGELVHVKDGDDDFHVHGGFADAVLPYRDAALRTWTYSLRNSGRFDVSVEPIVDFGFTLADVESVEVVHDGVSGPPRAVTLGPGETVRVELLLRSMRCEQVGPDGYGQEVLTNAYVRQRALWWTKTVRIPLPQQLVVGDGAPGSLPCPRPYAGPPPDEQPPPPGAPPF